MDDTVVTYTGVDASGNIGTATQTVTVEDTTAPEITGLADMAVEAQGVTTVVNVGTPVVSDIADPTPTISNDYTSGVLFPLDDTIITWVATDESGNSTIFIQTITVEDTTPPDLIIPADITVEADDIAGTPATDPEIVAFLAEASAVDLVDGPVTVLDDAPTTFPFGVTTVTFDATDSAGNAVTGTATVTVVDGTVPVVTPPADITVEAEGPSGTPATNPTIAGFLAGATAIDNIDGSLSVSNDAPADFQLGPTTVTFSTTDDADNVGTATATVTVEDTIAPDVTAPAPVTVEGNSVGGATGVALGVATVSDIADPAPTLFDDAPALFPLGTTVVTHTGVDASGNTSDATQDVTVVDTTPPDVTAPADITIEADGPDGTWIVNDLAIAVFLSGATAEDLVDGPVAVANDAPNPFPLGPTLVTFSATDATGNTGTATATLTIVDTTAPDVVAPDDQTVLADGETTQVEIGLPSVNDLVDPSPSVTNDAPEGDWYPIGTTIVTWTITDAYGNTIFATQTVTVEETIPEENLPPSVTSDELSITVDEGSSASNSGAYSDPEGGLVTITASIGLITQGEGTWNWTFDAVDGPSLSQTVIVTATDVQGAATESSFELIVVNVAPEITDTTAPATVVGEAVVELEGSFSDAGTADTHTVTVDWGDGTVTEAAVVQGAGSGSFTDSHSYASPDSYDVIVTVTDQDGDTDLVTITIGVGWTGRMTGGGRVDTGDVEPAKGNAKPKAILTTHGFELFINDAEEFGGNLQFNDHRNGDVFHATSIDQILFTNDPSLDSGNPGSSFNTARVSGAGRLNGVDGVRFTAVITDNGEPGKTDTFEITFPDGENPGISGVLEGGNHQAH